MCNPFPPLPPPPVCRATPPLEPSSSSLVPQTLEEFDSDQELQELHNRIATRGQAALTREEEKLRTRSLARLGIPSFSQLCADRGVSPLARGPTTIFQLNIGLYCNQACGHCHVESSPRRTELMTREIASRCIALLDASPGVKTLDLTGGAPELCPEFKYLVIEARKRGIQVIDRCNLTVLLEPGQERLADFLAEHHVHVVASLPCYTADNVDSQRGRGVFDRSIQGLQALNKVGYGIPGTGLSLDLVYNPGGVFLAPPQAKLEDTYRIELSEAYGIQFTSLLCLNNMPIKRWADELQRRGQLEEYMAMLVDSFNPEAAEGVMCRNTVSVGWDGRVFDCDFNQQLDIPLGGKDNDGTKKKVKTVFDLESLDELSGREFAVASHCYGCTAGFGGGCGGQSI